MCNSSAIIDHLQNKFSEEDIGIAFIYCNYKEQEEQTIGNLMRSLLQQLLQRRSLPAELYTLYQRHTIQKIRLTISESLELLHAELSRCSRAFIIVDALDECSDDNGSRSALVEELFNLPTTTSLMMTSRHVASIQAKLNQARRLEIRASDTDVRIYL